MIKYILLFIPVIALAEPIGVINEAVTQETIDTTICVKNWTQTIRPHTSYTNKLKLKQLKDLNLSGSPTLFEEDHMIPLELGGHPTDPNNLWPQAWLGEWGAHKKDVLENKLHRLVCANKLSLDKAQSCIRDWHNCTEAK